MQMGSSSGCFLFLLSSPPSCCVNLPLPSPNHGHVLLHSSSTHFHLRASSSSSSSPSPSPSPSTRRRRSRRPKSDDEICEDIRQFLAAVGLPDHHIPSTKELLLHGRNDLANIVRRRGHKRIEELLTSSFNDSLDTGKSFVGRPASDDCKALLTGQNVKEDRLFDDVTTSTEVCLGNNLSSLDTDSTQGLDEHTSILAESSANLTVDNGLAELKDHTEEVTSVVEENFYSTEVAIADNDCNSSREGFPTNFYSQSSMPTEISEESSSGAKYYGNLEHEEVVENDCSSWMEGFQSNFYNQSSTPTEISVEPSLETEYYGNLEHEEVAVVDNDCSSATEGLQTNFYTQSSMPTEISGEPSSVTNYYEHLEYEDGLMGKMAEDETFPSVVPSIENHYNTSFNVSALDTEDKEVNPSPSPRDLSLEQNGYNNIAEYFPSASEVSTMEDLTGDNKTDSLVHSADSISINLDSSANLSLEEKVANFIQNGDLDPVEDQVSGISNEDDYQERDDHMPNEDQTTDFNNSDTEAPKVQNQSEINHLKFMLYQKELELSRLKEQIEKEKIALSVLQTEAEAEISRAKKLISEKNAELLVAEESLSGLKEVQVDFFSDGDVVEVAGSFNGWHHRIKMDPQPSVSAIDHVESRISQLWSTVLWLYPGVYEIKFVVDGQWVVDPQRESVTRGHICNNILRVDR